MFGWAIWILYESIKRERKNLKIQSFTWNASCYYKYIRYLCLWLLIDNNRKTEKNTEISITWNSACLENELQDISSNFTVHQFKPDQNSSCLFTNTHNQFRCFCLTRALFLSFSPSLSLPLQLMIIIFPIAILFEFADYWVSVRTRFGWLRMLLHAFRRFSQCARTCMSVC